MRSRLILLRIAASRLATSPVLTSPASATAVPSFGQAFVIVGEDKSLSQLNSSNAPTSNSTVARVEPAGGSYDGLWALQMHVVPGVGAHTSNGRDNDFAPFDAGGYMISPSTGTTCSTGFAISLKWDDPDHHRAALH